MKNKDLNKQIYFSYGIQVILAVVALILAIWTYFAADLKYISVICLSLALAVSAFNYYTISHNTKAAIAYITFAFLALIALLFGVI